jgi:hypothetical protein
VYLTAATESSSSPVLVTVTWADVRVSGFDSSTRLVVKASGSPTFRNSRAARRGEFLHSGAEALTYALNEATETSPFGPGAGGPPHPVRGDGDEEGDGTDRGEEPQAAASTPAIRAATTVHLMAPPSDESPSLIGRVGPGRHGSIMNR